MKYRDDFVSSTVSIIINVKLLTTHVSQLLYCVGLRRLFIEVGSQLLIRPSSRRYTVKQDNISHSQSGPSGVFRIWQRGAYNGGLGAEPPAGSRGRAFGRGVRGKSP